MKIFNLKLYKLLAFSGALVFLFSTNVNAQGVVQTNVPALKDIFENDFSIGCLLSYAHIGFSTDPYVPGQSVVVTPEGGDLIKYHMNSMSPGNWMKSTYIVDISGSAAAYSAAGTQAEKDSIDIHPIVVFNGNIIAQLNWAQRQGFTFRGHTLIWHSQNPGTAFFRSGYTIGGERLSKERMTERMENFIKEVIRIIHEDWPGLLTAMDVVNEAINEDGSDRTSDSEWYQTFGDNSYVMKSFEFARKYTQQYGETQMKLYYNDYRTHVPGKSDGIVELCGPIFRAGFLDGIGMQEHDGISSPTAEQWIASYNKFDTICTEMSVTELDVNPGNPIDVVSQAFQYEALFKCFLDHSYRSGRGKIVNVSKDGLNDEWAFVDNASLWDDENQCKPSFYQVVSLANNYHDLQSLFLLTDTLDENNYPLEDWSAFNAELTLARDAMNDNYSASASAASVLGNAHKNLEAEFKNLTGITTNTRNTYITSNKIVLSQNHPNPFISTTTIEITLPEDSKVYLAVYDIAGRIVSELVKGNLYAGNHKFNFNASHLSSGIYFYSLIAGDFYEVKKLMLIR